MSTASVALFAVARGVDYEPPPVAEVPPPPAFEPPRHRTMSPPARQTRPVAGQAAAAAFADAVLRRVLEVLDRRRPLTQLRPLLAGGLVDSLLAGSARHSERAPARLRRVQAQIVRPDGSAAEVAACYTRGDRAHAIACRIEELATPTGRRWQVVALHMG